jgi:hypothetical protein
VLHEDTTGLEVNVYDASDFDDTLPDVLRSVVARLQAQANEPDGKVARQAIVLLHKTLRSLPDQAGGASAPRGGAEQ